MENFIMLPKVLFLRMCKAGKGLFSPNERHTDLTVTSISHIVTGDSGLNVAPNGTSWWLVASTYFLLSTDFDSDFILYFPFVYVYQHMYMCFFPTYLLIYPPSYVYGSYLYQPELLKRVPVFVLFLLWPGLTGIFYKNTKRPETDV